jgi:hypothetical protein
LRHPAAKGWVAGKAALFARDQPDVIACLRCLTVDAFVRAPTLVHHEERRGCRRP